MEKVWHITLNGLEYHLTLNKSLSINGETFALSNFKKKMHLKEYEYFIPLGNVTAVLHIFSKKGKEPILTIDNRDCMTGAVYEVEKIPAWAWIFAVLHILNMFFIMGGAIGGALAGVFLVISLSVAVNKRISILVKLLGCIGIYIVATILTYFIATTIFSLQTW